MVHVCVGAMRYLVEWSQVGDPVVILMHAIWCINMVCMEVDYMYKL